MGDSIIYEKYLRHRSVCSDQVKRNIDADFRVEKEDPKEDFSSGHKGQDNRIEALEEEKKCVHDLSASSDSYKHKSLANDCAID